MKTTTKKTYLGPRNFCVWAVVFESCQSARNIIIDSCIADWLLKTSQNSEEEVVPRTARAGNNKKSRTLSRQRQQRARQRRKFHANEASRIQELFKTYPRNAVSRVIGGDLSIVFW